MKKYINLATFYLVIGLLSGVFYREFTKINNFSGKTFLSVTHTHTLILGFIFFLIVLLFENNFKVSSVKHFSKWMVTYNVSLIYVIVSFIIRGVMQVLGTDMPGLNHIAGLGHALLGISLVWFIIIIRKAVVNK